MLLITVICGRWLAIKQMGGPEPVTMIFIMSAMEWS